MRVHIPNRKGACPYPQLERGWSISQTGNGQVHEGKSSQIAPSQPPTRSPIRGAETTPKTEVGIRSTQKNCPARAIHTDTTSVGTLAGSTRWPMVRAAALLCDRQKCRQRNNGSTGSWGLHEEEEGLVWFGSTPPPDDQNHGQRNCPCATRLGWALRAVAVSRRAGLLTAPEPRGGTRGREIPPCLCVWCARCWGAFGSE